MCIRDRTSWGKVIINIKYIIYIKKQTVGLPKRVCIIYILVINLQSSRYIWNVKSQVPLYAMFQYVFCDCSILGVLHVFLVVKCNSKTALEFEEQRVKLKIITTVLLNIINIIKRNCRTFWGPNFFIPLILLTTRYWQLPPSGRLFLFLHCCI